MSNKLKIAVGLPAYGDNISAHHARMWMEFGAVISGSTERFELVHFGFVDVNPISTARWHLHQLADLVSANWLLMLDADTWVEAKDPAEDAGVQLLRMISDADRADASIVCAPVVRRRTERHARDEFMIYDERGNSISPADHRIPFPIAACATACFAINIPRTRRLGQLFQFKDGLSEDLYACRLVRETGGVILCDPRVRTGHRSRAFPLYSS